MTKKRSRKIFVGFLLVAVGLVASAVAGFFLINPLAIFLLAPAALFIIAIGADGASSREPLKGTQYISTHYGPHYGPPFAGEADEHQIRSRKIAEGRAIGREARRREGRSGQRDKSEEQNQRPD